MPTYYFAKLCVCLFGSVCAYFLNWGIDYYSLSSPQGISVCLFNTSFIKYIKLYYD